MGYRIVLIAVLFLGWLWPAAPANGTASWCTFDPSCICIWWSGSQGGGMEIRCPGGGGDYGGNSGWPNGGASNQPPGILEPEGSFGGNGQFGGPGILQGQPLSDKQYLAVNGGKSVAAQKLSQDPECKALFANSPLTENGAWLLTKIQWRDGKNGPGDGCQEPDVAAFHVFHQGQPAHEPIVYLCPIFESLARERRAITVIHELLHVAGQLENGTASTGPDDPPDPFSISKVVSDACNLSLSPY